MGCLVFAFFAVSLDIGWSTLAPLGPKALFALVVRLPFGRLYLPSLELCDFGSSPSTLARVPVAVKLGFPRHLAMEHP